MLSPQPAANSRRWKRFAGQLVLLALVGGFGFALAIILRIHDNGKETTVRAAEGSDIAVGADGQVDIKLPNKAGGAAANAPPTTPAPESTAPPKVAAIRPHIRATPDYLETTGEIIAEKAADGTAGPVKLLQFDIDQRTFARMLQVAKNRNAGRKKPAGRDRHSSPESSGINWPSILHINYGYVAAGEKDFPHRAEVKSLTDQFDPKVAAVPCTATIPESDAVAAPRMSVRVRVDTGTTHYTLALLQQAVFGDGGKQFVYLVNGNNVVERLAVEASQPEGGLRSQVTGLNRNDIVIADPSAVKPGMAVKPDFIAGALQSPTPPLEFSDCPLMEIVEYLRDALHIEIQIDERGLAVAKIAPDVQCSVNIRDVSLASGLKLLLRSVGLTYVVEDEYILITAPGKEPGSNVQPPNADKGPRAAAEDHAKAAPAPPLPTVRVTQPVVCNVSDYEEYSGGITGDAVQKIMPPGHGAVEIVVYCKEGTTVGPGDLLAKAVSLSDPKLQPARNERLQAEQQLRLAAPEWSERKRISRSPVEGRVGRRCRADREARGEAARGHRRGEANCAQPAGRERGGAVLRKNRPRA